MSEAYSEEPVDPDQVKKLLEFGDDYRNFIDSQSDCASSLNRRSHNTLGYSTHLVSKQNAPINMYSTCSTLLYRNKSPTKCYVLLFNVLFYF